MKVWLGLHYRDCCLWGFQKELQRRGKLEGECFLSYSWYCLGESTTQWKQKAEGNIGVQWGTLSCYPLYLLFLISSTNTVISTTNYNNYSLAKTWLTESLLLVHEVVNTQVLRRSLLCTSLLEYLNGLLLCHYLDFKCNYSQGGFFFWPKLQMEQAWWSLTHTVQTNKNNDKKKQQLNSRRNTV